MKNEVVRVNRLAVAIPMFAVLAAAGCVGQVGGIDEPMDPQEVAYAQAITGNGAPSGGHFTLNMIGVANPKTTDMTNNGSRIFVPLTGSTKIMLAEGNFQVLDANGTDGTAAFQLPNPDPTNCGTTRYSVFARALGKPGGSSTQTTCATDPTTGEVFCSIYSSVQVRSTGKSSFTNVSRELLYIYADVDGDGTVERYNLFNTALEDYFWQYDNSGLRLLQLRFYPVPTTVP